ncbi:hypothetical protein ABZ958_34240 [Streptomyces sp. NPDC046237]|uniref:hypothetical protein n=1 Tax=Streptomyces sp. NPDC046237 TaxID=3154914 RepID=UPI0033E7EF92
MSRGHDRVLAEAVRNAAAGHSGIVVLVGSSSTGKTRAVQAVQPLAGRRWRLWHPFDPARAQAALEDLPKVAPRTVVWLNEAQRYLGDRASGERIAAAIHRLLVSLERGPILLLGTLWPEYAYQYAALPWSPATSRSAARRSCWPTAPAPPTRRLSSSSLPRTVAAPPASHPAHAEADRGLVGVDVREIDVSPR